MLNNISPMCVSVEFAGLPATGKTNSARHLRGALQEAGMRVAVVRESSDIVPLRHLRGKWQFNAGMVLQMFHRLLVEQASTGPHDVVIFDRGAFDASCWFDWLLTRGMIDARARDAVVAFLRDVPWTRGPELVFHCDASFGTILERRKGRRGFVANEQTLDELRPIYQCAVQAAGREWPAKEIVTLDTDKLRMQEMADVVISRVLSSLDATTRAVK